MGNLHLSLNRNEPKPGDAGSVGNDLPTLMMAGQEKGGSNILTVDDLLSKAEFPVTQDVCICTDAGDGFLDENYRGTVKDLPEEYKDIKVKSWYTGRVPRSAIRTFLSITIDE